ncbi:MAG: hypothetical protein M5R42_20085 [Rhodocyclaceae bacterium]|nr:hypothetical protein [Rhodocyclaceae bacterium]
MAIIAMMAVKQREIGAQNVVGWVARVSAGRWSHAFLSTLSQFNFAQHGYPPC